MGVVVQNLNTSVYPHHNRIVFVGGYGGLESTDPKFDGLRSRSDIWTSYNGYDWIKLADSTELGSLAWMGINTWNYNDYNMIGDRIWVIGGGFIGDTNNAQQTSMIASTNTYYSYDAINWIQTNYDQGGGTSDLEQYSSSEWSLAEIDGDTVFVGLWGLTLEVFAGGSANVYNISIMLIIFILISYNYYYFYLFRILNDLLLSVVIKMVMVRFKIPYMKGQKVYCVM
jgi:hypothetical protein